MSAAVTALIELAFNPDQDISTKALAQLEHLDDPQATKALKGLIKWGANRDMRSTARHYLLRKTAQQRSLPQGVRPTTPPTLFNADPIIYDPNPKINHDDQDLAEPFLDDDSNQLASDIDHLDEPFTTDQLSDTTEDLAEFDEPFLDDHLTESDAQTNTFAEPFLNEQQDQTYEKEQADLPSTFEAEINKEDEFDWLYEEQIEAHKEAHKEASPTSLASKTTEKVELLTTNPMLATSESIEDEGTPGRNTSPLPVPVNVTASRFKLATTDSHSSVNVGKNRQEDQVHPIWPDKTDLDSEEDSVSQLLPQLLRHDYKRPLWLPSLLLALTTIGELFFLLPDPVLGMGMHIGVLFLLLYSLVYVPDRPVRRMNTVFLLIPMIRIMSFGLPLAVLPKLSWYFFTAIPIFTAMILITRTKEDPWTLEQLGLTLRQWPIQLGIAFTGVAIGWLEYLILTPAPLSQSLSWQAIWLPALVLLICTGFLEELLFRGFLQSAAIPVIGRWPALIFVSALFAILHIGYASVIDVLFVFGIGFGFALAVDKTHSILGVTLAHAIANISLYLIFPHLLG